MHSKSVNMMPEKTPLDYSIAHYALVVILGAIGGAVSVLQDFLEQVGKCWKCAIARAIVSIATSGFCGVLAFWLCESGDFKPLVTAFVVGISGHMGGRALTMIEKAVIGKMKSMYGDAHD